MFGSGGNGRDVVSMTDKEKARRMAPLRTVEAYWKGLCGPDAVPLRAQVDPRGMETALEYAFLAERIAPSLAKLRVAGTHLSDLMGMEVSGMPLSTLIAPTDRDRLGQAVTRLFSDPAILRIDLRAEGGFGKPDMSGHMIILPLRSDMGDVSRALGAVVTNGRIGRTPRRFEISGIDVVAALDPTTLSAPAPTVEPVAAPRKAPGLAESKPPFTPAPKPERPRKASHLRLVVSND